MTTTSITGFRMPDGRRATYGASPGDENHPGPYLYVSAWDAVDPADPFWNSEFFTGASLPYERLLESRRPLRRRHILLRR